MRRRGQEPGVPSPGSHPFTGPAHLAGSPIAHSRNRRWAKRGASADGGARPAKEGDEPGGTLTSVEGGGGDLGPWGLQTANGHQYASSLREMSGLAYSVPSGMTTRGAATPHYRCDSVAGEHKAPPSAGGRGCTWPTAKALEHSAQVGGAAALAAPAPVATSSAAAMDREDCHVPTSASPKESRYRSSHTFGAAKEECSLALSRPDAQQRAMLSRPGSGQRRG